MKAFTLLNKQKGFTLIELMIVVGIIGILVAIAAPNFSRYQSKARQSEAKIALAAIYGAEKSFYSEYASYAGSMDAIGYSPEGQKRFYAVGWTSAQTDSVAGYGGNYTSPSWNAINNSFNCTQTAAVLTAQYTLAATNNGQEFNTVATGCIRQGQPVMDTWNINETKILSNNIISL